ncbi:MAG: hypothetical protein A3E83_07705 [Gammaproteobacteria bacterium RIFCSPHIGHO2_12_FULL_41_20]|nr:MAG: hypothetical protein A3E83_07705 [Gammaproteobacteria bacterium RIFCSPHIGHO2_12_FULL_41_20]
MPEIITKYPDTVLQILRGTPITCAEGKQQNILTTCPKDRFCSSQAGELCVYDVKDMGKALQIQPMDVFFTTEAGIPLLALFLMILLLGIYIGTKLNRK